MTDEIPARPNRRTGAGMTIYEIEIERESTETDSEKEKNKIIRQARKKGKEVIINGERVSDGKTTD